MWFGQAKRPQHLPLRQRLQPLLFLRRIAELHQNGVHRAIGDRNHRTGATIARRDFFQNQGQRQVVQPGAAQFFRHTNAISAQRCQPFMNLFGKGVRLVPLGSVRPKFSLSKGANRVADHFLVLG